MELTTKKKSYRWNKMIPIETTQKITETFIDKKSYDLLTSGLKLLNESIQECGVEAPHIYTWDENHPLIDTVTTSWLNFLSGKEADRKNNTKLENISSSIEDLRKLIMHRFTELHTDSLKSVNRVQRVKSKNQVTVLREYKGKPLIVLNPGAQFEFKFGRSKAKMILENIEAIEAFVASESKDIVAAPVPQKQPKKKAKKTKIQTGRFTHEQVRGSLENKRKLGLILKVARKGLWPSGPASDHTRPGIADQLSDEHHTHLHFEPYCDYTGRIRTPLTGPQLGQIEDGRIWPSAKALHGLAELYSLNKETIKEIWSLIPYALAKSIEEHCPKDSNLFSHLSESKALPNPRLDRIKPTIEEPVVEQQEEENLEVTAEVAIPDIVESLGEITEPVYRTRALKIAVLGMLDKNTARQQRRGFGRHTVVFVDGDKPKSIQPAFYDGVVALNRVSHTSFSIFSDRCGNPPQLRFKKNGEYRVNSVNLLRAWLEQYDKGEVEIW